jgi:hypothetical protein
MSEQEMAHEAAHEAAQSSAQEEAKGESSIADMATTNNQPETIQTATSSSAAQITNPETAVPLSQTPPETVPQNRSPRDAAFEQKAVRRGCFSIIFGATLGAFVGAALTLSLLAWLNNGSLSYNGADVRLQHEIEAQATTLSDMATRQMESEAELDQTVENANRTVATAEAGVAELRVTAVYQETRIAGAGNAADTLNAFLLGLNDLLTDVSLTVTPVPTTTTTIEVTATATAVP